MKLPVNSKNLGRERPQLKLDWILETKFPNMKSAVGYLTAEEIWSIDYGQKYSVLEDGCRVYYRCNRVKIDKTQCSVLKYLYISNKSDEVWLYKSKTTHNHDKTKKKYHFTNAEICEMGRQLESDFVEGQRKKTLIQNCISNDQKKYNKWIFENTFDMIHEAKNYIKQQKIWSYKYQKRNSVGLVVLYRCKLVKKTGPQCAAQKYLRIDEKKSKFTVYQKVCPHTHNNIKKPIKTTMCNSRTKTDLIKCLYKNDRDAILKRGFRVLEAVRLRNCLIGCIGSSTSLHTDDSEIETQNICKNKFDNPSFTSDWIFEKKFPKEQMALKYLAEEAIWAIDSSRVYRVAGGLKIYYRCNQVMVNGPECAAWKCLFYSTGSEDVSVYKKNKEHTHDDIARKFGRKPDDKSIKRKRGRPRKLARKTISNDFNQLDAGLDIIGSEDVSENEKQKEHTLDAIAHKFRMKPDDKLIKRKRGRPLKSARKIISKSINQPDSGLNIIDNSHADSTELVTGDDSTQYIINYIADDQISEDREFEYEPNWIYERSFATSEKAMRYLNERNWINVKTSTKRFQTKIYYCCNMFTKSGSPCNAQIYLLRCAETNRILVFRNLARHSHLTNEHSKKKIKNRNIPLPTGILKKIQRSETERAVISLQSENINELITPDDANGIQFMEIKFDNEKYKDKIPLDKDNVFEKNNLVPPGSSLNITSIVKEELIITDESIATVQRNYSLENRTIRSSLSTEANNISDSVTEQSKSKTDDSFLAKKNFAFINDKFYDSQVTLREKFSNISEAMNKMKQESPQWVSLCMKQFENEYRQFFRCNYNNKFEKCSCRVVLLERNDSDEVLYYSSSPHFHGDDLSKSNTYM